MIFNNPYLFLLLLLSPLLFHRVSKRLEKLANKPIPILTYTDATELRPKGVKQYRKIIQSLILLSAFILLVVAIARPQKQNSFVEVDFKARDIMLVLDTSRSMKAMDFSMGNQRVDRMTALKKVTKEFVVSREGDRIGMVVFGTDVFTQCPLTRDTKTILSFLDTIQPLIAGPATAIGDALAIALKRIKDIDAESKVIILVTDGKNNAGTLQPIKMSELAKELGIKIHVIGVGSAKSTAMPTQDIFGRSSYRTMQLEYDEETLKQIASNSDGIYFNAQNTKELEKVYSKIDELETRNEKSREYINWTELYKDYLFIALCLLLLFEVLNLTIFMVIP